MLKWLKFLFFLLSLDTVRCGRNFCENSCPPNEVYSRNVSQCQNTCFNQKFNLTSNCHSGPGCICESGYIRHQDSYKCVKTSTCAPKENPKQCPSNEVYSKCGAGCFKTCSSRSFNTTCVCKSGCVCKKGFIRSDINFQCIPESSCKTCPSGYRFVEASQLCVLDCKICGDNEFYNGCGTCEVTCQHPQVEACTHVCREGCYCIKGLIRDEKSGLCIRKDRCPSYCNDEEIWQCGNTLCEKTCQNYQQTCTKMPIRCEYKCFCKEGFVRALEGAQCVSERQCATIQNGNKG